MFIHIYITIHIHTFMYIYIYIYIERDIYRYEDGRGVREAHASGPLGFADQAVFVLQVSIETFSVSIRK